MDFSKHSVFSPFAVLSPEDDSVQSVQSSSSPTMAKIRPALKKIANSEDLNPGSPLGAATQDPRSLFRGNQFSDRLNSGSSFPMNNNELVASLSEKRDLIINPFLSSLPFLDDSIRCLLCFNYGHRADSALIELCVINSGGLFKFALSPNLF